MNSTVKQLLELTQDLLKAGKKTAATLALERAFHLSSDSEDLVRLGRLYLKAKDLRGTLECYKKALAIDPSCKTAAVSLSVMYNDLGMYEKGKQTFEKIRHTTTNPEESASAKTKLATKLTELSNLYYENELYQFALEELQKVLRLENRNSECYLMISNCLVKMNKHQEALDVLLSGQTKSPKNIKILFAIADLYQAKNLLFKSVAVWENILRINPSNPKAKSLLAKFSTSTEPSQIEYQP